MPVPEQTWRVWGGSIRCRDHCIPVIPKHHPDTCCHPHHCALAHRNWACRALSPRAALHALPAPSRGYPHQASTGARTLTPAAGEQALTCSKPARRQAGCRWKRNSSQAALGPVPSPSPPLPSLAPSLPTSLSHSLAPSNRNPRSPGAQASASPLHFICSCSCLHSLLLPWCARSAASFASRRRMLVLMRSTMPVARSCDRSHCVFWPRNWTPKQRASRGILRRFNPSRNEELKRRAQPK